MYTDDTIVTLSPNNNDYCVNLIIDVVDLYEKISGKKYRNKFVWYEGELDVIE